jgi:hypothetical protein
MLSDGLTEGNNLFGNIDAFGIGRYLLRSIFSMVDNHLALPPHPWVHHGAPLHPILIHIDEHDLRTRITISQNY